MLVSLFNKVADFLIKPTILLKKDPNTGVFLRILRNFYNITFKILGCPKFPKSGFCDCFFIAEQDLIKAVNSIFGINN